MAIYSTKHLDHVPQGTELVLITDKANLTKARTYLHQHAPELRARFCCVEEITAESRLSRYSSFNRMMKNSYFLGCLCTTKNF